MICLVAATVLLAHAAFGLPTDAERQDFLNFHNEKRRLEGSSDIPQLVYDLEMEAKAQRWADKCEWTHSSKGAGGHTDCANNACGQDYGENLWMCSGTNGCSATPAAAIKAWYAEKPDWTYNDGTYNDAHCAPGAICGHYTQVISRMSQKLGCAYSACAANTLSSDGLRGSIIVCQYDPPGNQRGGTLYTQGTACTNCAIGFDCCEEGLCVGSAPTATGTFTWDVWCDGSPESFTLDQCSTSPTSSFKFKASLVASHRAWSYGVAMYDLSDGGCTGSSSGTLRTPENECSGSMGFDNLLVYSGSLPTAPGALPNGAAGSCSATGTSTSPRSGSAGAVVGAPVTMLPGVLLLGWIVT